MPSRATSLTCIPLAFFRDGQNFRNAFNLARTGDSYILKTMKTLRIVFGVLAFIPLALLVNHILIAPISYDPNSPSQMAFMVFGVPILVFNLWLWMDTQIIEFYFFGQEQE